MRIIHSKKTLFGTATADSALTSAMAMGFQYGGLAFARLFGHLPGQNLAAYKILKHDPMWAGLSNCASSRLSGENGSGDVAIFLISSVAYFMKKSSWLVAKASENPHSRAISIKGSEQGENVMSVFPTSEKKFSP